jgi:hypothetical protein
MMLFQVDKISLTTNQFHSYYGGSEIIVAGKVTSSNKVQLDEDLGAQVNAWNGAEHKEVLYKPLFTSENNPVRLSSINKITEWMVRGWIGVWMDAWVG